MINNTDDKIKNRATDQPLVSICCITYNHAPYIRECLDGFLMQKTDFAYEILIHDDASTDGTQDIIKEYELKYPEIIKPIYQTVNQYSQGIAISQNYLWPRAQGRYIATCEGDDYWISQDKLQKQVDILEEHPELSACSHLVGINRNGVVESNIGSPNNIPTRISLIDLAYSVPFQTSSFIFRKDMLNIPSQYANSVASHFLFMLLAEQGDIYFMNKCMSIYRIHDGGVYSGGSTMQRLKLSKWSYTVRAEYFSDRNPEVSKILLTRLSEIYTDTALKNIRNLDFIGATLCLSESLKYSKGHAQCKVLNRKLKNKIKSLNGSILKKNR